MRLIRKHCGNHFPGESWGARIMVIAGTDTRIDPRLGRRAGVGAYEHVDEHTDFNFA
jgi:hypothetical protein